MWLCLAGWHCGVWRNAVLRKRERILTRIWAGSQDALRWRGPHRWLRRAAYAAKATVGDFKVAIVV